MQIVTVQFNYPNRPNYLLLLDVFKTSVKIHMPKVKFIEFKIAPPKPLANRPLNFKYNDSKLKIWRDFLDQTNEDTIFADCDMLMVKSAKHAFDIPFDIAYTKRTIIKRIPMNGGIVFVRPSDVSRKFFHKWYEINHRMLHDSNFHYPYRCRWAGMNQSAWGYMMENGCHDCKIHAYTTRAWNAVDCDWKFIDENTVFIHYKSELRKLVLKHKPSIGKYKKAQKLWNNMYTVMLAQKRKRKKKK